MCAQGDHPPYDIPEPQPPRRYALSGDAPEPHGSVALAVLGTMIEEAETAYTRSGRKARLIAAQLDALREARRRVTAAEAAL